MSNKYSNEGLNDDSETGELMNLLDDMSLRNVDFESLTDDEQAFLTNFYRPFPLTGEEEDEDWLYYL